MSPLPRVGSIVLVPVSIQDTIRRLVAISSLTTYDRLGLATERYSHLRVRRTNISRPCVLTDVSPESFNVVPLATFKGKPIVDLPPLIKFFAEPFGKEIDWRHKEGRTCYAFTSLVPLCAAAFTARETGAVVPSTLLAALTNLCKTREEEFRRLSAADRMALVASAGAH
ncbi:hypothetical protein EXIGLDRAFT_770797 [Exidia glandulosa HHB12029]|uniref:Uncharacterized protein n=1 Tax=Exidia glandulosa HHB12029 TaxID=1314781 RepID=A0A165GG74_EXIGL|nr:hypothetical protein EXIGLDRAFT_770797 [Exidia glandulosa HHB12029]